MNTSLTKGREVVLAILHATTTKKKKTVKSERKCWILGSYSGDYEQYSHLGCNTVYFSRNSIFWRIISLPPSGLKRVTKIRWKE
jgi:hypothetical protein